MIATDGACSDQDHPLLRRGGVGVFLAPDHPANVSEPLGGMYQQSAQRAEVKAGLMALQLVSGPLELLTDSQFLFDGLIALQTGTVRSDAEHWDLWRLMRDHVTRRGSDLKFTKVQALQQLTGHNQEAEWNAAADALATKGAKLHCEAARVAPTERAAARWRMQVSRAWHTVMIAIADKRAKADRARDLLAGAGKRSQTADRVALDTNASKSVARIAPETLPGFQRATPTFPWQQDRGQTEARGLLPSHLTLPLDHSARYLRSQAGEMASPCSVLALTTSLLCFGCKAWWVSLGANWPWTLRPLCRHLCG